MIFKLNDTPHFFLEGLLAGGGCWDVPPLSMELPRRQLCSAAAGEEDSDWAASQTTWKPCGSEMDRYERRQTDTSCWLQDCEVGLRFLSTPQMKRNKTLCCSKNQHRKQNQTEKTLLCQKQTKCSITEDQTSKTVTINSKSEAKMCKTAAIISKAEAKIRLTVAIISKL